MDRKKWIYFSHTDKLCCLALAVLYLVGNLAVMWMDEVAYREAEAKAAEATVEASQTISYADYMAARRPAVEAIQEAVEAVQEPAEDALEEQVEGWYMEDVPLSRELQWALKEACEENGVPLNIALGLIEVESNFKEDAFSSEGCVGLMQLNTRWFPANLTSEENIRSGVAHLGGLLKKYDGDTAAALRAYNRGFDDGDRAYANSVLAAADKWGNTH